jgi:hypothetical protein
MLKPWRRTAFGGLQISFARHLDGGGPTFGQEFVPFLRSRGMPVQPRAFEWCAGPGFIGFSLLSNGLCQTLCLADINPQAVAALPTYHRGKSPGEAGQRLSIQQSGGHFAVRAMEPCRQQSAALHRRFRRGVDVARL